MGQMVELDKHLHFWRAEKHARTGCRPLIHHSVTPLTHTHGASLDPLLGGMGREPFIKGKLH